MEGNTMKDNEGSMEEQKGINMKAGNADVEKKQNTPPNFKNYYKSTFDRSIVLSQTCFSQLFFLFSFSLIFINPIYSLGNHVSTTFFNSSWYSGNPSCEI